MTPSLLLHRFGKNTTQDAVRFGELAMTCQVSASLDTFLVPAAYLMNKHVLVYEIAMLNTRFFCLGHNKAKDFPKSWFPLLPFELQGIAHIQNHGVCLHSNSMLQFIEYVRMEMERRNNRWTHTKIKILFWTAWRTGKMYSNNSSVLSEVVGLIKKKKKPSEQCFHYVSAHPLLLFLIKHKQRNLQYYFLICEKCSNGQWESTVS